MPLPDRVSKSAATSFSHVRTLHKWDSDALTELRTKSASSDLWALATTSPVHTTVAPTPKEHLLRDAVSVTVAYTTPITTSRHVALLGCLRLNAVERRLASTAAEPTQVCTGSNQDGSSPTATPICSVDPILGAGCTGSFSDYLTLTQSGPASTPTGPASESSTPSSSAAESTPTPASQYTPPSSTAKASPTTAESTSTTVKTSSTTERTTSVIAATYSPATASTTTTAKAATSTPVILPLPTTVVATTSTPAAFTGGEAAVRPIWGLLVSLAVAVGLGMTLRV
ncbi:MAG: hypothetical protein M1816_004639 [Peltula sp. TS41687]|nr:MAG: hypothetical protein M1816_004639 [Peltula sp. TS41687]